MPPLRAVCSELKWKRFSVYSFHPIASPVVILYRRVILSVLRFLSPAHRACVALDEYQGNNGPSYEILCQTNWRCCHVAEPIVAQSTPSVSVVKPSVQASAEVEAVVVPPVTPRVQPTSQEEEKRVTSPVEEPASVATTTCREFLVVLLFQNTRKLVTVTSVTSAVTQARPGGSGGSADLPRSRTHPVREDGVASSDGRTQCHLKMSHQEKATVTDFGFWL